MKIKIFKGMFAGTTVKELEDEVNEFIKDKRVINIKYQETTDYHNFATILVLYDDKEN